jgi:hypothetical protein
MEAIFSSETSVATQQTTRRHIPEDDTLQALITFDVASMVIWSEFNLHLTCIELEMLWKEKTWICRLRRLEMYRQIAVVACHNCRLNSNRIYSACKSVALFLWQIVFVSANTNWWTTRIQRIDLIDPGILGHINLDTSWNFIPSCRGVFET